MEAFSDDMRIRMADEHVPETATEIVMSDPRIKAIADHHSSPEDAGIVFSRAKPKLAAFSHIAQLGSPAVPQ
jgi:ribonuclease Z